MLLLKRLRSIDFILLVILLSLAYWLYVIPVVNTFGERILYSDEAIAGLQAQRTLTYGLSGAFHITWSPLFPWLIAALNKFFGIALDDGGVLLNGWALTLRIIPMYFLARLFFNRVTAISAAIIILSSPMMLTGLAAPLAQTFETLIILVACFISTIALRKLTYKWYLLSGALWGLSYLNRLEEWIYILPLLGLSIIPVIHSKNALLFRLRLTLCAVAAFILVIFPYLNYVKQSFGVWTLNAKSNIQYSKWGGSFSAYYDKKLGLTSPAQVIFSGDPKYYVSGIWHPTTEEKIYMITLRWDDQLKTLSRHITILKKEMGVLYWVGIIGVLFFLLSIFRKHLRLLIALGLGGVFIYYFANLSVLLLRHYESLAHPNIFTALNQYRTSLFIKNYDPDLVVYVATLGLLAIFIFKLLQKHGFKRYLAFFDNKRSELFIIATTMLAFLTLWFAFQSNIYSMRMAIFFALFAAFAVTSVTRWIVQLFPVPVMRRNLIIGILSAIGALFLAYPFFQNAYADRETKGMNGYLTSMWKDSGYVILDDYGPGAKIGLFHEGPAFYAQGEPFYIINDTQLTFDETLEYLYLNNVDYIVATREELYMSSKKLRPLMDPQTKLKDWEFLHIYPDNVLPVFTDTDTNILVVIWKRK